MKTLIGLLVTVFTQNLLAVGIGITYQGRILNSAGIPVTGNSVQFLLQIKTPGNESCLLYQEQQTKNLSTSGGIFAITLNDGSGARTDSGGYSINQIFANYGTFTFASGKCAVGTTYTPITIGDGRILQVYFNDGTFTGWEPMPVQKINYAPFAIEATQISGFSKDSLLRVEDPVLGPQAATSLTPTNFTDLLALINGTSTKYMTSASGAAASLPPLTSAPTTPAAGQIWYNSTTNTVQYYDGTTVQSVGSVGGSISSINGLTGSTQTFATGSAGTTPAWSSSASTHTLSIPLAATASVTAGLLSNTDWTTFNNKVSTVAGKTGSIILDIADLKSTVAGNFFTGPSCTAGQALTYSSVTDTMSCAAITTTNFSGSLAGEVSGTQDATVVNKIKGTAVSAAATAAGQFLIYNGTTQYAPLAMSGDATLSSAGVLAVTAVGGVTAVNVASATTLANAATSANTANAIVRRDPSGNFTAGNVTGNVTGAASLNVLKTGDTVTGPVYFQSNKGATATVGGNNTYSLEAYSADAGAAGMSFHRGGYYAVNMGLDPDNVLRIGGWSAPANLWQLDMAGNQTVAGSMSLNGNVNFANANPTISASSYFIAPGGAYFNSGTVYAEAPIQARGGIHNDTNTSLTISGGTSGYTYFPGSVGIGTGASSTKLTVYGTSGTSLLAITAGTSTYAIQGQNSGGGIYSGGVAGVNNSTTTGYGVYGTGNTGVYGSPNVAGGTGVFGGNGYSSGNGVAGWATSGYGIYCQGLNCGGTAAWTNTSDRRLKTEIQPIENALEKLLKLDGVTYHWKNKQQDQKEGQKIGLIAQDVEKIFPQVVKIDTSSKEKLPGGTKSLSYAELVSPIIQAIKEFYGEFREVVLKTQKLEIENAAQGREIASVKDENLQLKQENAEIKSRLDRLENAIKSK